MSNENITITFDFTEAYIKANEELNNYCVGTMIPPKGSFWKRLKNWLKK